MSFGGRRTIYLSVLCRASMIRKTVSVTVIRRFGRNVLVATSLGFFFQSPKLIEALTVYVHLAVL